VGFLGVPAYQAIQMKESAPHLRFAETVALKLSGASPRRPLVSAPQFSVPLLRSKATCTCGGGCPRCTSEHHIQTKLTVSQPGDIYEVEADRVAEEVTSSSGQPPLQRKCACEGGPPCPKCGEDKDEVVGRQTEQTAPGTGRTVPAGFLNSLGPGRPLDESTRAFFEPRFGYDFSQVRLHVDTPAMQSARAVNALAYTVGRDVVFAAGQYAPHSMSGRRLLAHELTHVVQQGAALPDSSGKQEANAKDPAALRAKSGSEILPENAASSLIQPIQRREIRLSRQTVSPTTPPPASDPLLERLEEAKALRIETLPKAIHELRQLEIAVEEQATPLQLWELFAPTIWALMLWVKVNVGDPDFAASIHEALRLMRANLNLTSGIFVLPDDASVCGKVKGAIAFFEGDNAYVCERSLTRNRTCLAASITHELYHVVGLTHPPELGNHCAALEHKDAMTNPYCITDLTFQIAWGADNTWSARC
jgi:hypothetical protein